MNICDNDIIKSFVTSKGRINGRKIAFMNDAMRTFLHARFDDTLPDDKPSEIVYRILHKIEERPKCKVCNANLKFVNMIIGYRKMFCSEKCMHSETGKMLRNACIEKGCMEKHGVSRPFKSKEIQKKVIETNNAMFGCDYPLCSKKIREKVEKTNIEKYGGPSPFCSDEVKSKAAQTMLDHLGVKCPFMSEDVQQKVIETNLERFGVEHALCSKEIREKAAETRLSLYGSISPASDPSIREKIIETNIERYGGPSPFCSEKVRAKIDWDKVVEKTNETKRANGTFKASKPEEMLYEILLHLGYEVIRQYRSEAYPFNCDFYLPELDIYIEHQGSQYHNGKPYEGSEEDETILKNLEKAAKDIKIKHPERKFYQYDRIIYVWTKRDVLKRETAKRNKLSLLELYAMPDIATLERLIKEISERKMIYSFCNEYDRL